MLESKAHPRRAPRFFAPDRVLKIYNPDRAQERERLRTMRGRRYAAMKLEVVSRVDFGQTLVITHSHALLLNENEKQHWLVSYNSLKEIVLERNGKIIFLDVDPLVAAQEIRDAEALRAEEITRTLIPKAIAKPSPEQAAAKRLKIPCSSVEQAERLSKALRSAFHRWAAIETD